MKLIEATDPRLFVPSQPVTEEDRAMHGQTVKDLTALMGELRGVGLAAPQVGLPLRFFVTNYPLFPVCFNPSYVDSLYGYTSKLEGCLSRRGWHTYVRRADDIRATFEDAAGVRRKIALTGIEARVFAHLTDLCNGKPIFPPPTRPPNANDHQSAGLHGLPGGATLQGDIRDRLDGPAPVPGVRAQEQTQPQEAGGVPDQRPDRDG